MGANNILKTLIIALAMAILAFVVGSFAAEGRLQSSLLPIMGLVGLFTMLYLGRNCWWLVFLVPALSSVLPLPYVFGLPPAQLVAAAVFAYWIVMWIMGYVTISWRSVIWVDIPVFTFCIYFAYTYVMHPVSIGVFGDEDADFIGGKDYICMALALVTYCAISFIPCKISQLCTIAKWTIVFTVILAFVSVLKGGARMGASGIAAGAEGGRFGLFSSLGMTGCKVLCSWNSPLTLFTRPVKMVMLLACLFGVAMGGWREVMVLMGIFIMVCAFAYRQLFIWVIVGCSSLGFLYYLSSEDVLYSAPYGVQRVLTVVPGLKLKKEIVVDASSSSDWRKEMWAWALNPRMGYIKDYVWGDGFGVSKNNLRLTTINMNRGRERFGDQKFFAETGTWHSGVILTIHRIGYVGLSLLALWILSGSMLVLRLCHSLRGKKEMPYALYLTAGYVGFLVQFCVSAGTYTGFFGGIVDLALAKTLYVEGMKEGLILPMFSRKVYVPLMLREEEQKVLRQARQSIQVVERR